MSAIFEPVTITWDGQEFTVTPTYRMVQQLEQHVSIAGVASRAEAGNPPMSHIAYIVSFLLTQAGKPVPADDVYGVMLADMDTDQIQELASVAVSAFMPTKKSDSGGEGA